jgi:hypothetical protein
VYNVQCWVGVSIAVCHGDTVAVAVSVRFEHGLEVSCSLDICSARWPQMSAYRPPTKWRNTARGRTTCQCNLSLHAVVLGCRGRSLLLQLCHKHRGQHPEGAPGWFEAATRLWWLFVLCSVVGDSDVAARVLRPACTREFCAAYALSARQDRWHWQECWCLRPFKGDPANLNRSRADCLICHASLREGNGTCTCINQACVRGMAHAQALINIGAIVPAQPGKGLWWRARKCS